MVTIGFFEAEGWEEKIVKDALPNDDVFFSAQKLDEYDAENKNDFEIISVFVNSDITRDVLQKFPNLKLITTRSTGFDHIDIEACKTSGIQVAFVPGYGDNTVAEFAFGLLLSLVRKIYDAIDRIKEKGEFSYDGFRGVDLKGKTIGIIGTGRIGREAIQIAKGFGMNIVAFDPYPDETVAKELGFSYKSLDEMLGASDFITIHAPYNESTHHLINSESISKMKKGVYLVNTARGGIIDTKALVDGLESGTIAGVALDVLEEEGTIEDEMSFFKAGGRVPKNIDGEAPETLETIIRNHILMRMPNVLITPHNAFNTEEALRRILNVTIQNIIAFRDGKTDGKSFIH
jgi:D-lactate dehydrogenase